jgi:hypothetical protein
MDVTMSIVTGGGRKQNMMRHAKTLKEVTTFEEAVEEFRKEFRPFFPPQATFDDVEEKRSKKNVKV